MNILGPVGRLGWNATHLRAVLAAWLVIAIAFGGFAPKAEQALSEMAVILGVTVLLDALLVRLVLMPVMLRLLGRWAWHPREPLHRVPPDVRFGHA